MSTRSYLEKQNDLHTWKSAVDLGTVVDSVPQAVVMEEDSEHLPKVEKAVDLVWGVATENSVAAANTRPALRTHRIVC
jgi:hypothetical protein